MTFVNTRTLYHLDIITNVLWIAFAHKSLQVEQIPLVQVFNYGKQGV